MKSFLRQIAHGLSSYQGVRTSLTRPIYKKYLVAYSRLRNLHYQYITKQPTAVGIELELSECNRSMASITTETTPVKTIIRMH